MVEVKTSDFECNGGERFECARCLGISSLCNWYSIHWSRFLVFLEKVLITFFELIKPYLGFFCIDFPVIDYVFVLDLIQSGLF